MLFNSAAQKYFFRRPLHIPTEWLATAPIPPEVIWALVCPGCRVHGCQCCSTCLAASVDQGMDGLIYEARKGRQDALGARPLRNLRR